MFPYIENITWDEYFERCSEETQNELLSVWDIHPMERKTGFVTSKCFLVEGKNPEDCYNYYMHYKIGSYSDEDFLNEDFWGTRDLDDDILDSTKM